MQTIYNAQGESKVCESVDAREHIEMGCWFNEVPVVQKEEEVIEAPKRAYNKRAE